MENIVLNSEFTIPANAIIGSFNVNVLGGSASYDSSESIINSPFFSAEDIPANSFVGVNLQGVVVADYIKKISAIGYVGSAVKKGDTINLIYNGAISDSTLNLTSGEPYFLGENGKLKNAALIDNTLHQKLCVAVNSTTFIIYIGQKYLVK